MNKTKIIKYYFDFKSSSYEKKSHSFPWNIIRKQEKKIILSFIGRIKNLSVVDIGCGSGFYTKIIFKNEPRELYAIDNSTKMLSYIKEKKIIKINQNIENLKLNKKFDKLICAGLLEFTSYPTKALINIRKIAKKNSVLVLLCPKSNFLGKIYKKFHQRNQIKINLFSQKEIIKMTQKSKWKLLKQESFLFSTILKLKINE